MEPTENPTITRIFERLSSLRTYRHEWDYAWQRCTEYVNPRRGDFSFSTSRGSAHRYDQVFDSTAPECLEILASGCSTHLTSATERWFKLDVMPSDSANLDARIWAEIATDRMYELVFNNQDSFFHTAIHELYMDLGSYGTSPLYIEDVKGEPIRFYAQHLNEHYVAENRFGIIDTDYRVYPELNRHILNTWGEMLSDKAKERLGRDPIGESNIIFAVEPPGSFTLGRDTGHGDPKIREGAKFLSFRVLEEERIMLEESSFITFPYVVPRWSKCAGETYGRSPAMKVMPTILVLNEMMKTVIRGAQLAVDPPLLVPDDGYLMPLETFPGAINYAKMNLAPENEIKQMPVGHPEFGHELIMKQRESIANAFYVDLLELTETRPQMTATEVIDRREEKMVLLSPMVSRLQTELLSPMIDRVLGILLERGDIDKPPVPNYMVDFTSAIVRSQKASMNVWFQKHLETMAGVMAYDPSAMDLLDVDQLHLWSHRNMGLPESLLRSAEEVAELRKVRQQQQQQAQELEQQESEARAAKDFGAAQNSGNSQQMRAV